MEPTDAPPPYTPVDPNEATPPRPPSPVTGNPPAFTASLRGGYLRRNPSIPQLPEAVAQPIPSALSYFEGREFRPTGHQSLIVLERTFYPSSLRDHFSFPAQLAAGRDVSNQDWTTFLNHVFYALESEPGSPESVRRYVNELGPEERHARQQAAEAVVAEWNEGFWDPRGIRFVATYKYEGASPAPTYRTINNGHGVAVGIFPRSSDSPVDSQVFQRNFPPNPTPHVSSPTPPMVPSLPYRPNSMPAPFLPNVPSIPVPPSIQSPFPWARSTLTDPIGRGRPFRRGDGYVEFGRWNGLGRGARGTFPSHSQRGWGRGLGFGGPGVQVPIHHEVHGHHQHHPHSHHEHHHEHREPHTAAASKHRRRSSDASSIVSTGSSCSTSSSSSSDSDNSIDSLSSEDIDTTDLDQVRQTLSSFRLDPTNTLHLKTAVRQLNSDIRAKHRQTRRDPSQNSREAREEAKRQRKLVKAEFRALKREVRSYIKVQRKEKLIEKRRLKNERKLKRKEERKQRRAGPTDYSSLVSPGEEASDQTRGVIATTQEDVPTDEKAGLKAREHEQVESVASSFGVGDPPADVEAGLSRARQLPTSPVGTTGFTLPRRQDSGAERQARLLEQAASYRERVVLKVAETHDRAVQKREKALDKARKDGEKALAKAEKEREKALRKAEREREKILAMR